MTRPRLENYYEARGFSVYYLANAVFNIVTHSSDYLRGIEEILGDMRTLTLMRRSTGTRTSTSSSGRFRRTF